MPNPMRSMTGIIVVSLSAILVLQIAASVALSVSERPLASPALHVIPAQIGGWTLTNEQALEPAVAEYLRPDDYILRDYLSPDRKAAINLFVAHFESLQNSYGPHSPRVCLPGSGWLTQMWKVANIAVDGRPEGIPVNQYLLEKNGERILVLYWYQNDRRIWAEEFQAKLHLLPDLLQHRRSDVSLVRISIPQKSGEAVETSIEKTSDFARYLFPSLAERLAGL